jgi:tetratricopeptide (TPR) repeat protein
MTFDMLPNRFRVVLFGLISFIGILSGAAAEGPSHFEQANRLYEEGKFSEAASLYESMLKAGRRSPEIFFNLGNTYFREARLGRAIFNYRQAERMNPRDPDVQANLRFTRERVTGALSTTEAVWIRAVRYFTLDELTTACTLLFWVWAGLVCFRQWRPTLQPKLRTPGLIIGSVLGISMVILMIAYATSDERIAIVTAAQAPVHLGPLSKSQISYSATDGTELKALAERGEWLQVSDRSERSGWVQATNVLTFTYRSDR